jgi:hypothetical protein
MQTNLTIAQADYIILASDAEMIALEEMFILAGEGDHFRTTIEVLLDTILELCYTRREAEVEVDVMMNYLMARLPYKVYDKHWHHYIVHLDGGIDTTDRRKDKRSMRAIVHQLAHNLRVQLDSYQLYDKHGVLMFEQDRYRSSESSLEIRLSRVV